MKGGRIDGEKALIPNTIKILDSLDKINKIKKEMVYNNDKENK